MYSSTTSPASADSNPLPVNMTRMVGVSSLVMLSVLSRPVSLSSVRSMSGQLGAMPSMTVKVADVVLELPWISVTVNVTVSEPVLPQPSLRPSLSLDHPEMAQLSVAMAPPLEANQAARAMSSFPSLW